MFFEGAKIPLFLERVELWDELEAEKFLLLERAEYWDELEAEEFLLLEHVESWDELEVEKSWDIDEEDFLSKFFFIFLKTRSAHLPFCPQLFMNSIVFFQV